MCRCTIFIMELVVQTFENLYAEKVVYPNQSIKSTNAMQYQCHVTNFKSRLIIYVREIKEMLDVLHVLNFNYLLRIYH